VRFWDTSAIIPLVIAENSSSRVKRWLAQDPDVIVWTLTRVELLSAIARRRRENPEASAILIAARRDLLRAWAGWSEITAIDVARRHAERLVETHPLRAGDAMQLAAALIAADNEPVSFEFVTLDSNLADAADREGFSVLGL
jgi:predicted nucleic acid-binding protein